MPDISKRALGVAAIACVSVWGSGGANSSHSEVVRFLSADAIAEDVLHAFIAKRRVQDYRVVRIDSDALRTMIRDAHESIASSSTPTISLPLLDGSIVSIELLQAEEHFESWKSGMATFIGRIEGIEYASVTAVLAPDGSLDLTMTISPERYKIEKTTLLPYHVYWTMAPGYEKKID